MKLVIAGGIGVFTLACYILYVCLKNEPKKEEPKKNQKKTKKKKKKKKKIKK